ncbi:MAG TPA: RidA family protein [Jatrophihabitans sp.]|nr:RidA family protein [Jatrophihabitans sp.]
MPPVDRPHRAPAPVGRYLPAVVGGGLIQVSGQGPVGPDGPQPLVTGRLGEAATPADARRAAELAMANVLAALREAPVPAHRMVRLLVLVACAPGSGGLLAGVAAAALATCAAGLPGPAPACTVVGVPCLPFDITVEIEAVAAGR